MSDTSAERKATPIASGVLDYFPLAITAVARLSKKGNDKHNPGEPLHWARGKSNDHRDCIARHLMDCGTMDPEVGELHDVALAWRALANLQLAEEKRLAGSSTQKECYHIHIRDDGKSVWCVDCGIKVRENPK